MAHERQRRIHNAVNTLAMGRGEDLLGGNVGEELVAGWSLARTALPHVPIRQANPQVGAVGGGVVQAIEVSVVQKAQVLLERCVVQLPSSLRVLSVGTSHGQNGAPQAIDRHLFFYSGKDLTRPGGNRSPGDAPRVLIKIHAMPIRLALCVARLGCRGGLCRVDALEGLRVCTLNKDEARARLRQGIKLLALP